MIIFDKDAVKDHKICQYRTSANMALEYQCKKVLYLMKEIDSHLEACKSGSKHYITSKEFHYHLDFLFSSFSTLMEYYYSWVIFSFVGSYKPNKIVFRGVPEGGQKFDDLIEKLLKQHLVKQLPAERLDEARTLLADALSIMSYGWVKEFLSVNNYMKHNSIVQTYAPKIICSDRLYTVVFLYVHSFSGDYINNSTWKRILLSEVNDSSKGDVSKDIFEEELVLKVGDLSIVELLGIEFIQSKGFAGISIHSVMRLMSRMCRDINDIYQRKDYGCGCPVFEKSDLEFLNLYRITLREEIEIST